MPPNASSSRFKPATRAALRLRMAIDGPSGSGKSVTALRFAHALALAESVRRGDGRPGRIAAVNTEAGGLALYQGETFDGDGPLDFCDTALASFAPTHYTSRDQRRRPRGLRRSDHRQSEPCMGGQGRHALEQVGRSPKKTNSRHGRT